MNSYFHATLLKFVCILTIGSPSYSCFGGEQERAQKPTIVFQSSDNLVGSPITLRIHGLPKSTEIELFSQMVDRYGRLWIGNSKFMSDANGVVDPSMQKPTEAAWKNIDPIGPFWALKRMTLSDAHTRPENGTAERISMTALVNGRPVTTASKVRFVRSKNVKEVPINNDKIVGRLFVPQTSSDRHPAIIVVPGSGGGIPSQLAERFASHGYAALALAYFGQPKLPRNLELVPLEYFDFALDWFKSQPFVDPSRIAMVGGSKGGELSLLVGSRRPDLTAIVAAVPSTYVFQSISDNWNRTSSWSVGGKGVPFVPYARSKTFQKTRVLADLYRDSLVKANEANRIPLEKIKAKVLMITGTDDKIWPANSMCRDALAQLKNKQNFQHRNFPDVGHEVFATGYRPTSWSKKVGGSRQGQALAQAQAWKLTIDFLSENLSAKRQSNQLSSKINAETIDTLDQLIRKNHVKPFWKNTQANYEQQLQAAKNKLAQGGLNPQQRGVLLLRILAALQDGHSGMDAKSRGNLFGNIPIFTAWFGEELRIVRIPAKHKKMLGAKVVSIDDSSITEVRRALLTVVPHANIQRFKKISPSYLKHPGLLYGLGLSKSPTEMRFEFETLDGKTDSQTIKIMSAAEYRRTRFVTLDSPSPLPLYRRNPTKPYWFNYDPKEKLFYLRFKRVTSDSSDPIWTWAEKTWARVDRLEIKKFVVDLRGNGGGGFQYAMPIVQGIIDRPKINQRGKLFVLTDYRTFSAAIGMAEQLECRSQAIFVGEPPCDHPASPGDSKRFLLGSSQIGVNLSQIFHATTFPNDGRNSIGLDVRLANSWKHIVAGEDIVMNYIRKFKLPQVDRRVEADMNLVGCFEYDAEKVLRIKNQDSNLTLEIGKFFTTPLYPVSQQKYKTEIVGFSIVRINKNKIELQFPDGSKKPCNRIDDKFVSPSDLLFAGRFAKAKQAYKKIIEANTDSQVINDAQFSEYAVLHYWNQRSKYGRQRAVRDIRNVLQTAIELFDKSPICRSMLEYYR